MGKKTKFVFVLGIPVAILFLFTKPTVLYFFGKRSIGKVIDMNVYSKPGRNGSTIYYYQPIVQYNIENKNLNFVGYTDKLEYNIGWDINIIYLPFYVKCATNQPRYDLFNDRLAGIIIFSIVWVAFFTSFKNVIDNIQIQKISTFRYKIYYIKYKKK